MEYHIKTIKSRRVLESCPLFYVDQFNWGGEYRPLSYGRFAYLKGEGFCLWMACEEAGPVCHYRKDFEPVWMDSAMEGFFAFDNHSEDYMNFEINSAGAMVAGFGSGKTGRRNLTALEAAVLERHVGQTGNAWFLELFIPLALITEYYGHLDFTPGSTIRLNFFKLAEGRESTHFASYAPIQSEEPNFHLPQFFATGILD